MVHYKLTYFNLKAKAEAIRLIFAYAKVDFEDCRIAPADWPAFKKTTPYGQVPILEVDGKTLAQSLAIERYLAKQFNLMPSSDWDQAVADELADLANDLTAPTRPINPVVEKDEEKRKALSPEIFSKIQPLLEKVESRLASNPSGWLVGEKISWVDLLFFSITEFMVVLFGKDAFSKLPCLQKLFQKIKEIPQIKEYVEKRSQTTL